MNETWKPSLGSTISFMVRPFHRQRVRDLIVVILYVWMTFTVIVFGASALTWARQEEWDRFIIAVTYAVGFSAFNAGLLLFAAQIYWEPLTKVKPEIQIVYREAERAALFPPTNEDWLAYPVAQYVYVIQDSDLTHYCKIGRTNNLQKRLGHFDVMLPFQFNVVLVISCRNMVGTETYLHAKFEDKRVRGEWFNLDLKDRAELERFSLSLRSGKADGSAL